MDDKDALFGYTFPADLFADSILGVDIGAPSLLNDAEKEHLTSFFNHNPMDPDPSSFNFPLPSDPDAWPEDWDFAPPASVHGVGTTTTIPNQALLHHGFHHDQNFAATQQPAFFNPTPDHLQAASTLYNQAQVPLPQSTPQLNNRSHSFPALSPMSLPPNAHGLHAFSTDFSHLPTASSSTPMHSHMSNPWPRQEVAACLDTPVTAPFANRPARGNQLAEPRRSPLKGLMYGTDDSFNASGFRPSGNENEEAVTKLLLNRVHYAAGTSKHMAPQVPSSHGKFPVKVDESESNDEKPAEEISADEYGDSRPKKRRKSEKSAAKEEKGKSVSTTASRTNGKQPVDDGANKRRGTKRGSVASQKGQRENLTEEQKRNNHILSEQKRRNIIKRGFEDLHELVPELRTGGLSKAGILAEAANFLQQLMDENQHYSDMLADG